MKKLLSIVLSLTIVFSGFSILLADESSETLEETTTTVNEDISDDTSETEEMEESSETTEKTDETSENTTESTEEETESTETGAPIEETDPIEDPTKETTSEETTTVEETTEETTAEEPTTTTTEETKPSTRKGLVKAPPVRATVNYLTYSNGSYYYIDDMSDPDAVPTAHASFPYRGEYVLGGDVPVDAQITPDVLTIDLNGFDLIDNYNNTKPFISVQQDDIFTLRDSVGTGRIYSNNLKNHTGVYLNNGGTFNFEGGTIEHFTTNENGGGINIWHKNDIVRMSGNATVKDCSTTNKSGGGGINVFRGKLYMSDNATVTGCRNTGQGAEKSGNGAGVHVGNGGTLYITDNVHIVNNSGNGYHGAGIDLWSDSFMYMSGSPVILNNINGKGYPCNLYIGSIVNIDGPLTGNPHDISITIQTDPVFTHNLIASNPGRPIEELLELFDADKFYWTDLPRHNEYTIVDHNGVEAKQAPVILVHFDQNHDNLGDWKVVEDVPGGYATNPGNPPARTGYNFNGWYRNANGTGNAFDFKNTNLPHEDFYLYAKWSPKTYNITINTIKDGTTTTTTTTATYASAYSNVFTADQYYRYTSIKIDNVEQLTDTETSYTVTIPNIAGAHTITLTEVKYQAVVTFNVVDNDYDQYFTLLNNVQEVVEIGSNVDLLYTINTGYYIESFAVEHIPQNSHQVQNVQNDVTVDITIGKQIIVDFTYEGYTNYVRNMYSTAYIEPNQDFSFDVATTDNEYYISEIIINGTAITIDNETDMYVELQNLTEDQNIVIKIAKRITMPDPTGFTDTITPIIIVGLLSMGCLVLCRKKKKS